MLHALRSANGNRGGQQHARDAGVNAGQIDRIPPQQSTYEIRPEAVHAHPVHAQPCSQDDRCNAKRGRVRRACVQQRDDQHGADGADDGAIRPSLTTCFGVVEPNGRCHCAWYCGAHDEFARLNASRIQPNSNTPLKAWPAGGGEVQISPAFLDNMLSGTRGPAQNAPVMKISAIDGSRHGSCSMTESALNR